MLDRAKGTLRARKLLVLGGARSGKSRFAEAWIGAADTPKLYIATAQARDGEMAQRIAHHKKQRGPGWRTLEAPLDIVGALASYEGPGVSVLVDCLTLWLSNLLEAEKDVGAEAERLAEQIARSPARIALVSNEVGLGIVPDNPLARRFQDEAGRLHQLLAQRMEAVVFVAAGLPLVMKSPPDQRQRIRNREGRPDR
jgi:adenosylcobinamide kinase/adenosylcobinamide-phosphate guanylyltransferase